MCILSVKTIVIEEGDFRENHFVLTTELATAAFHNGACPRRDHAVVSVSTVLDDLVEGGHRALPATNHPFHPTTAIVVRARI